MFLFPALINVAEQITHDACAVVVLALVLMCLRSYRLALDEASGAKLLSRELLPPSNAPPGAGGGLS